ncbi:MAG: glycosyltransferase family 4 protein [Lachnospiraceae bacterium]|nr:glycosyltransferase family 4 protein [Lachnospiraceae bacterium]
MKICFLIGDMARSGGTERVLSMISAGLEKKGHEILILNMYGQRASRTFYPYSPGIQRGWLSEAYPETLPEHFAKIKKLRRFLKEQPQDVLVEVDLILALYTVPARTGLKLPVISWEHFNYYYQFRKNNRIRRLAMRFAAVFSEKIVVLTKEDQSYYRSQLHLGEKVVQIYNPNSYPEAGNGIPYADREPVVLAAGRLTKAKGFDYLLRAWYRIEPQAPGWRLVIAGEGEERDQLEAMIASMNLHQVILAGQTETLTDYYEHASLFVLSSRFEGFGMVLTEAMSFGLPVVSFDCKAGPKEIVSSGENGYLVTTGDVDELARCILSLIREPKLRETMGNRARESAKRFDLEPILEQWESLLKEIKGSLR